VQEITLTEVEAGQRLDRYLRKLLPAVPLGAIFRMLRQGDIRVDDKKAGGELRLTAGMKVTLRVQPSDVKKAPAAPKGGDDPLDALHPDDLPRPIEKKRTLQLMPRIVWKDDQILVVSKPAGLAMHPGSKHDHTLVSWLAAQRVGVRTATFAPAPAHRLDRGTSGLVVIGLTPDSLRSLTASFRKGEVEKTYFAVVHGVPAQKSGSVIASLWQDPNADPREAKVVVDARGQSARTDYDVSKQDGRMALLRVKPQSGRQHQIRAHLAHIGHPIVGDHRYGSVAEVGLGFLLHAGEIAFPHPSDGRTARYTDPIPREFHRLFDVE